MSDISPKPPTDFQKAAADVQSENLLSEFWAFLAQNKKWWLLPIVIVMLLLGTLILLSSTAAAPLFTPCFEVCRRRSSAGGCSNLRLASSSASTSVETSF